jgi:aryl-alcohol dehydrogenase-like predicted oxidoreductase
MSTPGSATPEGTRRYVDRNPEKNQAGFYRLSEDRRLPSIGIGTYLGEATDEDDEAYYTALKIALENGVNLIDTAINYRYQRSERTIGRLLNDLFEDEQLRREEVLVATKGGFIPFEGEEPDDPLQYIRETFVEPGLASPDDFTQNGHCMTPDYLDHQLHRSRENLGLDTLDIYYVHNPEMQLRQNDEETVYEMIEDAFARLEEFVEEEKISTYGIATWDGLRVDPQQPEYLSLKKVFERAERAGGEDHHFDAVQLPFNLGMSEALTKANQTLDEEPLTVLEACNRLDLTVFTSASLLQGRLADRLPEEIREDLEEFDKDVHRSLQFTRSALGVTSALVGMKTPDHVRENLELGEYPPYEEDVFKKRFLREV